MVTRRTLIKSFIGTAVGCYFFHALSLVENDAELLHSNQPALAPIAPPTPLVNAPIKIYNKPFVNAANHIMTPTYDHSGQAVHPSIIDFKTEYGVDSWGGFRYWMALTPYPYFNSAFENPSLLVSMDGLNWHDPPEIKNPLVAKPSGPRYGFYNSDPELIYEPDQNVLILYWREFHQNEYEKIWAKKITSNFQQSNKFLCIIKPWDIHTGFILSPTVWRKSAQEWYMWTTDGISLIHLNTSNDSLNWKSGQTCKTPLNTWNGGYVPWHIVAKPNYIEQKIEFLIAGWPKKDSIDNCQLFYATAQMSEPSALYMPLQKPLLVRSTGEQWDNGYIYRSSFVIEPGDTNYIRIWYSACSKKKIWHFGYTEGILPNLISSSKV